ncbi:thrombospondin type 3 repeat-containing protein [Tenacibaculum maritimum]|uniref:thrombospondin type 3 repeat-containing protein n=1 Tax=Tenacibaculum maritimum TaxID=107401 RepID=UPI001330A838|nr:thrombospondin type 3 repeat-containing protein [Tenacibaculum maritimum]
MIKNYSMSILKSNSEIKSTATFLLLLLLAGNFMYGQCTDGELNFTWSGQAGGGNQFVWNAGQRTGSDAFTSCASNVTVTVTVDDDNNGSSEVYYDGSQSGGNSTSGGGAFANQGLTIWLDNNENLFDADAMIVGERATIVFDFSVPVELKSFLTGDIDWNNPGNISSTWRDFVRVSASNGGTNVPVQGIVQVPGTVTMVGQLAASNLGAIGSTGGLDPSDPRGHVIWNSQGNLITSLRVTYEVGVSGTGQQSLLIGSFLFDADADNDGVLNDVDQCEGFDDNMDADGDGIADGCDLDADNDGILNVDEYNNCIIPTIELKKYFLDDFGQGTVRTSTPYISNSYFFNSIADVNDGEYCVIDTPNPGARNHVSWGTYGDHTIGDTNGKMLVINSSSSTFAHYYKRSIESIIPNTTVKLSFWARNICAGCTSQPDITYSILDSSDNVLATANTGGLSTSDWVNYELTVNIGSDTDLQISLTNNNVPSGDGNDLAIDDISFSSIVCDSDSDTIPNYLDVDSDNDGCPDAMEGGNTGLNLTDLNILNQLVGGVDTNSSSASYGVPIIAGGGQVDVSSTNASVQSAECNPCDATSTLYSDRDGDNVGDACDSDDDNDGILDENEGCPSNFTPGEVRLIPPVGAWEVFLYDGRFQVLNALNPVDVPSRGADGTPGGLAVLSAHGFYTGNVGTYTFNDVSIGANQDPTPSVVASGVDMKVLTPFTVSNSGDWSIVYKRTIENNGTITIGAPGSYVDDWIELFINGVLVDSVNSFTASLPVADVISENISAGDVVEVRLTNGLDLGGFNLSIQTLNEATLAVVCDTDTDNDGVLNHLDTDSDDDGCPDAIEGAGNIIGGLSTLTGGSPTAGSSSQNLGTNVDAEGNPKINAGDTTGFEQNNTAAVIDNTDSTGCTADLSLTKKVNKALPKVGEDIVYILTVKNEGPLNASGVKVTDVLPVGLTYKYSVVDLLGTYTNNVWDIGNLNVGESVNLRITATVTQQGTIINTAEITQSNQVDIDSTPMSGN